MQRTQVYFDENVPVYLADSLTSAGFTVHLPQNLGTLGKADSFHLQTSASRGWVLVTLDRRDFRRLHWLWMSLYDWELVPQPHSGILTIFEGERTRMNGWPAALLQKLPGLLPGEMHMWRPSTSRWELEPAAFMQSFSPGSSQKLLLVKLLGAAFILPFELPTPDSGSGGLQTF